MMRNREVGWPLELWEIGMKDIQRRVILVPTPGRENLVWHSGPPRLDTLVIGVGSGLVVERPVTASEEDFDEEIIRGQDERE